LAKEEIVSSKLIGDLTSGQAEIGEEIRHSGAAVHHTPAAVGPKCLVLAGQSGYRWIFEKKIFVRMSVPRVVFKFRKAVEYEPSEIRQRVSCRIIVGRERSGFQFAMPRSNERRIEALRDDGG
jgi:hypothetical protein